MGPVLEATGKEVDKKEQKVAKFKKTLLFLKTIDFKVINLIKYNLNSLKLSIMSLWEAIELLSSVRQMAKWKRRTKNGKIKTFIYDLWENGIEAVKTLNLGLRALKMFNCTLFQSKWDLPIMLLLKKKQKIL